MRPTYSVAVKWTSWFSLLLTLLAFNLAAAQSRVAPKRESFWPVSNQPPDGSLSLSRVPAGTRPAPIPDTTTDTWTGGGGSNTDWSDTSNWNNGAPSGQNVLINLTTAATVEDDNANIGTLTLSNAGDSVAISNNTTLTVGGNIENNGTITLNSSGSNTLLSLSASVTLSGSGTLVLGTGGPNYINGASGTILTNESTIEGVGNVGNGQIAIDNGTTSTAGTINANVSGDTLTLEPGAASTNMATLEATNGGILVLSGGTWTNTGGTITAAAGSTVDLQGSVSITGGTLTTTGSGVIDGNGTVYLTTLTNSGTYNILNNTATEISGTITNNGTINLDSSGSNTLLYLAANSTLTGSGTVVLGSGGPNYINGAGGTTLTNDSTIEGVGNIGNGQIAITNNGTINANVSGDTLAVVPASTATNTATLEATNGGILVLSGGTWTNTGGTITAAAGSTVDLENSVSITGGTLTTSGTGVINGDGTVYLTTLTNKGTYDILNNTTTEISGTITNDGTINLNSSGSNTFLYVPGSTSTTLTGSGTVVLGTGGPNYINGGNDSTLTIDQTISGVGNIGNGQITTIVNNGTIDGNISPTVTTAPLYIEPSSGGLTNSSTGVLEATNGGTLVLDGGAITNKGTIEAVGSDSSGNASTILLQNGVSITGGTLTTSGAGVIDGDGTVYLTTLTNKGTYNILNNTATEISGTITNDGTINLDSSGSNTLLYLAASSKLTGTGTVVLGSGGPNYINGASGTTLTNSETIEGAGNIGNGQIKIVNNKTINADVSGGTLVLEPAVASTNSGTLEATDGGTLALSGSKWTQTGKGTITAATGSTVDLENSVTISGGTLTTSGTGVINGDGTVYLTNLTNNGTYNVVNNTTTEISGTITNNGTINLDSSGSNTFLYLDANTTLAGTGAVVLGSGGPNYINGAGGTTLTNDSTIEGVGNIGNGQITVTNNGTIDANVSGGTLAINPVGGGFTNYNSSTNTLTGGTYIANAGTLTFAGSSSGITTLAASVVEENGGQLINTTNNSNALANLTSITSSGSLTTDVNFTDTGSFSNAGSLTILGSTTFDVGSLAQISGNTLTAGTYVLYSNLGITGTAQNITTNEGNITLAGGTIENTSNSTNALAGLNTNSGTFGLANDANFTTAGDFNNTGTLSIAKGSTLTVTGTLAQVSGSTLTGGSYVLGGTLELGSGISLTTNAANLTLEGGTIKSGTANALASLASNTGTLEVAGNSTFTTSGNFNNSGVLDVTSGSTFSVGSNTYTESAGTTTVDGALTGNVSVTGGTLLGAGTLKNNVSVGGSGTAPSISVGDAGKAGLLKITGTYTQLSTGTLNVTVGGTALGSEYSRLEVTGTASLSGTLTVDLINSFTPKVGASFTILSAKSITGTFSTQYIDINSSEYFAVSYTSKGVVLTVDSGTPPTGADGIGHVTDAVARRNDDSHFTGSKLTPVRGRDYWSSLAPPYRAHMPPYQHLYGWSEPGAWGATNRSVVAKLPYVVYDYSSRSENLNVSAASQNWTLNQAANSRPPVGNRFQYDDAPRRAWSGLPPLVRLR